MSEPTKKALVPVLRFPEFRDAGEWKEIKLNDAADKKVKWSFIGGPFGSNLKSSDYTANGVRIIQLQNIGDAEFNDNYKIFTSDEKADELLSCNIYPGDIILSKMGDPVGRACLIPNIHDRYVMCSDGIRLVIDEKSHIKYFIYSLINSIQFRTLVEKTATGSTRKRIGLDDLKNLPMVVPKVREQQKIADCLSSIDELVTAQTQKVEALKAHKKGLMQQLFPAESETVPKLRFPEFRDAGEWKKKSLNQITTAIFDGTHQTPAYTEDGVPFFSVENIVSGKLNKFISREDYQAATSKNKPEKGDILITRIGNIGFSTVVNWDYEFSIYVTLAVVKMDDRFNSYYLHSFMQSGFYQTEIRSKSLLNAVPCKINMDELRKTKVLLPAPEEQQKIANCLSSIDDLITTQTQKLAALKAHKKGLMQQLFPSVDDDCMDAGGRATQDAKAEVQP